MQSRKREGGIALAIVLVVVMLLALVATTFASRSITDSMISANKDRSAEAAALARGGLRLATAILFQTRVRQALASVNPDGEREAATEDAFWARIGDAPITTRSGAELRISIRDSGARLNLNALVPVEQEPTELAPETESETFLVAILDKVKSDLADEMGADAERYDTREMARNLLDYMDPEDTAIGGRNEDDYYLRQDPPHRAPNRPLLSVGEVAMVEGFDAAFVKAMEPYVTVHPFVFATGINLNMAEPWVLATLFIGSSGDKRLADEDQVRNLLKLRADGGIICSEGAGAAKEGCRSLSEVLGLGEGSVFPATALPAEGTVFEVVSEARVGDITRTAIATVDMTNYDNPLLLSWEMR
jgi:type II secretory pathway component PulK